jgi:hypothetical protein
MYVTSVTFGIGCYDLGDCVIWTDVFARPRSAAPVFAVRRDALVTWKQSAVARRLSKALDDLGAVGIKAVRQSWKPNTFDFTALDDRGVAVVRTEHAEYLTAHYGLAFLDGGWARRGQSRDYDIGPDREWIVGLDALVLLCHRMKLDVPTTGRFRSVSSDEELETRWELQRRDETDLHVRSSLLAAAGDRPQLEELSARLRSPEPIPQHCVDPLLP